MKKYLSQAHYLVIVPLLLGSTLAFAAVPDVTDAVADITGSAVPLALIGGSILAIVIGIKMYKKFRGAV